LRTRSVAVAAVGALVATGAWFTTFPKLDPAITSLQYAGTQQRAESTLEAWTRNGQTESAKHSITLDWPFIALYVLTLALFGILTGRRFVVAGACAAGVLDVLENGGLLVLLDGHTGQPVPALTATAATLKGLLIVVAAGVVIVTLPRTMAR
jgi:hypothetical protein